MRLLTVKLTTLLSAIALVIAHTSSMACIIFLLGEPKMPSSLYIKE